MCEIVEPAAEAPDDADLMWQRPFAVSPALIIGGVAFGAFVSLGFLTMPQASPVLLAMAALAWGSVAGVAAGWLVTEADQSGADQPVQQVW